MIGKPDKNFSKVNWLLDHLKHLLMRGLFLCFRSFFMLFCNFLRINPKLVVKINRAQIKHFRIRNAILQVGQTLQILRKKKNRQLRSCSMSKWPWWVSHDGEWTHCNTIVSGFSCSTWTQNIRIEEKQNLLHVHFWL